MIDFFPLVSRHHLELAAIGQSELQSCQFLRDCLHAISAAK